ncbi:prolyl oligopeptidase family serine peptidase [Gordonia sp. HY442]|uniref:alpha/beta hydrolase family protein n=1 Tax=Gordonia zhenghanii TaxID=2911516 RepID=UPI001F02506B|nr:lipase family protein [Gordonia zhenghanii]MCF8604364.1 prolyl oligopeptidase family serine peptidase [Gordonia zhenghanii]
MTVATSVRLPRRRLPRRLSAVALACAAAAGMTLVAPAAHAEGTPAPVWSGLDARHYDGPIGHHGTLISKTRLDASVTLPAAGNAYRILYSSPDIHGKPAVSTGAVFLPKRPAPAGGYKTIAWAHGTVGLGDTCAPSAQPRSDRDTEYLGHWLKQGYAVVATDYVGLGTPSLMSYLSGQVSATSTVDSVIAAQQAQLPLSKTWAIVGQSQGAGAALNAARRATALSKGSGLDYRGVVATGAPANIEHIVWQAGPQFPPIALPSGLTTYAAYIVAGFTDARSDLHVDRVLSAAGRRVVRLAEKLCYPELEAALDGAKINSWFTRPLASIPGVQAALVDYMGTPHAGYDRPIFLGQGLKDIDVPAPSALSLYAQMRAAGQPVDFHVYPTQDHSGTVLASMKDSTPFLKRIMR